MQINYFCISYVLFVDILTRSFDDFISVKFLIAVFLPVSPFINFGDFCQPPRLLHPLRLLFWLKFARFPVYSALPFYLKLETSLIKKGEKKSVFCFKHAQTCFLEIFCYFGQLQLSPIFLILGHYLLLQTQLYYIWNAFS